MKTHFLKKAAALVLVLSLFISLLSVAAAAEGPDTDEEQPTEASLPELQTEQTVCADGEHIPDLT